MLVNANIVLKYIFLFLIVVIITLLTMARIFILVILIGKCAALSDNYFIVEAPEENMKEFKKEFLVYWNVPTFQCASKKIPFQNLYEKFGIIQNNGDKFYGEKITILYELGKFPSIIDNKSSGEYGLVNNGVPQDGNLEEHLVSFKEQLLQKIPDPYFDGVGVIDFEMWRPVFDQNFGSLNIYRKKSIEIEKKQHSWWRNIWINKEAAFRFETAARKFMEATLVLAKQMRPNALWGYYGFPHCFNMRERDMKEDCVKSIPGENDNIYWLWAESTALFPSIYSSKSLTTSQLPSHIKGRIKESARVGLEDTPILPYFWFRYRDAGFFSEEDLSVALSTLYQSKASGLIIWGSSNDVNTIDKCNKLYNYVETVLGPNIAKYTQRSKRNINSVNNVNKNFLNSKPEENTKVLENEEIVSKARTTNYEGYASDETTQSVYDKEMDFRESFTLNNEYSLKQNLTTSQNNENYITEVSTESSTNVVYPSFVSTENVFYNDEKIPNLNEDYLIIIENYTTKETYNHYTTNADVDGDYLIIVRKNDEQRLTKQNKILEQSSTTKSPSDKVVKRLPEDITDAYEDMQYDYYNENIIEIPQKKELEFHSLIKDDNDAEANNKLSESDNKNSDYLIVVNNNYREKEVFQLHEFTKSTNSDDYLIIVNDFNDLQTSYKNNTDYIAIDKTKSNLITESTPHMQVYSSTEESVDNYKDEEIIESESTGNESNNHIEPFNSNVDKSDYLIMVDDNFTNINMFTQPEYTENTDILNDYLIIPKYADEKQNFTTSSTLLYSSKSNFDYVPDTMNFSTTDLLPEESAVEISLSTENDSSNSEILKSSKELFITSKVSIQTDFTVDIESTTLSKESSSTAASFEDLYILETIDHSTENIILINTAVTDGSIDNVSNSDFIRPINTVEKSSTSHIITDATENSKYFDNTTNNNDDVETKITESKEYNEFKNLELTEDRYSSKSFTSSEKLSIPTETTFFQNDFTVNTNSGTDLSTGYYKINEENNQQKEEYFETGTDNDNKETKYVDQIISYIYKK